MVQLSHKYLIPSDRTDELGLPKMLENFPNFLKACDEKGEGYLSLIFEEKAKNED